VFAVRKGCVCFSRGKEEVFVRPLTRSGSKQRGVLDGAKQGKEKGTQEVAWLIRVRNGYMDDVPVHISMSPERLS
jgi:hypothetical protein